MGSAKPGTAAESAGAKAGTGPTALEKSCQTTARAEAAEAGW
jgi:hypothetical protein